MKDFNKLTERAQAAVIGAQRLAEEYRAPEIDSVHLLASLLEDPEGVPAVVLRQLGTDVARLEKSTRAVLDSRAKVFGAAEPTLGRELRDVL
jgi:ATP-dependent Clp protease ATP-binding subunit ClpB